MILATCRVCGACGSDDLRTMFYPDVPLWRRECAACGSTGPFVYDDDHEQEGAPMLTSEKQLQVAEAAEAIEAAAAKVRALCEGEPNTRANDFRRDRLEVVAWDLSNQRRRLLEAWSE